MVDNNEVNEVNEVKDLNNNNVINITEEGNPVDERFKNKTQTVLITFSNGMTRAFTGKAFFDNETEEELTITNIRFSLPQDLPKGYSFESLNTEE